MRANFPIAAALTAVIMLVSIAHAPVIPAVIGASLACAFALWRGSGGG